MSVVLTAGSEFSVNTNTAFNQTAPEIAALPDGGYVIVWGTLDTAQDGNNSAIKAQRFDADGNKVGPEILVNSEYAGSQFTPDIAAFADGSFVITWTSNDPAQDGDLSAVKARLFDASGNPAGPEFLVNTQTISSQDSPRITVLENGDFVVSWCDVNGFDTKAQVFSSDGQKIGGEIRTNIGTTAIQDSNDIVALEGGGFVVTWRTTDATADGSGYAVMARLFDSLGVGGAEFVVSTAKASNQNLPNVTALPGGGFVVVWQTSDTTQDGSSDAVKGQIFDASGDKVGSEFRVNTAGANVQREPTVAALENGGFVVVWNTLDSSQDGSASALKGQYFDASGQKVGSEFLVNSLTSGGQFLPSIATLADGSILVSWTSETGDGSGYAVRGRTFDMAAVPEIVSDGGGATASIAVAEGETAVTTVIATDADSPAVTYSITGGSDAALFTIDAATGALSFLSAPDHEVAGDADGNGVYEVVLTASDGQLTDSQAISVTVSNINEAPVLSGETTLSLTIGENSTAVTTISATDVDGPSVTYAITGGSDAALFAVDAATGALNFVAAPDHEAPGDADGDNVYEVVVTASDGALTDSQAISVSVSNVNEAPVLAGGTTLSLPHAENQAAVTTIVATDVDGPSISYAIAGGNDAGLFAIDANTGALSFITPPDFEAPADFAEDNFYTLTVSASDGTNVVEQRVEIMVTNVNEGVAITSNGGGDSATVAISENGQAVTTVAATDLDGDAVGYLIVGGADASRFAIDAVTGAVSFVAAPDYEAAADADHDNVYEVIVQASDGSLNDQQTLNVRVGNVNEAPQITSGGGGSQAAVSVAENSSSVTVIAAADPEGGSLTYSISGGADASHFVINPTTGALSFVAAPNFEAPADAGLNNVYDVQVTVGDGTLTDTQSVAVSVANIVDGVTLTGTNAANQLTGGTAEDTLRGLGGNDTLWGGGGADSLYGDSGNDTLYGGSGSDQLIGGVGADRFLYSATADSLVGSADVIGDFSQVDKDRIGLSGIDANANVGGDQAFIFIGSGAFTGTAGQLRYEQSDGNTWVMGDVNGDGVADFAIEVIGNVDFVSRDFVL